MGNVEGDEKKVGRRERERERGEGESGTVGCRLDQKGMVCPSKQGYPRNGLVRFPSMALVELRKVSLVASV